MELSIKAKLENVFKAKNFTDSKSGEVTEGKWQLNFIELVEGEEGSQMVMHKVSIPEEKAQQYKDKIGNTISVPVKAFVNKGKLGFYGV